MIVWDITQKSGGGTKDPHFKELSLPRNTEVTISFDRLGSYGVSGSFRKELGAT
jgi:hypothetical protein